MIKFNKEYHLTATEVASILFRAIEEREPSSNERIRLFESPCGDIVLQVGHYEDIIHPFENTEGGIAPLRP